MTPDGPALTKSQHQTLVALAGAGERAKFVPIPIGAPLLRMGLVQRSPEKARRGYMFLTITRAGRDLIGV